MKINKIAILTSGGDAPGMNAVIYSAYLACIEHKIELVGVAGGYGGLIDNKFVTIDYDLLDGHINDGGSAIKSGRSPKFVEKKYFDKAIKNLKVQGINHLIVIGGDGSFNGAIALSKTGLNVITVPATIDNDLNFTHTLGYDSATNQIVYAYDNIMDSLSSFDYGAVIKIMGNHCPDLLENVARSIHTDYKILNNDADLDKLANRIKKNFKLGRPYPVILLLEKCLDCEEVANILTEKCKKPIRPHTLGYIQRGGRPSAFDRAYGYEAGYSAINSILNGESGISIGMNNNVLVKISFAEALSKH